MGCLGEGLKTQVGKDQGGTSMGRWQGAGLEGSDTCEQALGHDVHLPEWALPRSLQSDLSSC